MLPQHASLKLGDPGVLKAGEKARMFSVLSPPEVDVGYTIHLAGSAGTNEGLSKNIRYANRPLFDFSNVKTPCPEGLAENVAIACPPPPPSPPTLINSFFYHQYSLTYIFEGIRSH